MTLSALCAVALLSALQVGGADAVPDPPVETRIDAPAAQLSLESQTPRQVVASLIREAMVRPGNEAAWRELADGLPTLEDPAGSAPTPVAVTRASARTSPPATWTLRWRLAVHKVRRYARRRSRTVLGLADKLPVEARLAFGGLALLGALTLGATRRARHHRTAKAPRPPSRVSQAPPQRASISSALWTVRSLAENGTSLTEIARKTGMAQDTLAFMLSPAARLEVPLATAPPAPLAEAAWGRTDRPRMAASRFRGWPTDLLTTGTRT